MGFICGILGRRDPAVARAMARALNHRGEAHFFDGESYSVAASTLGGPPPALMDGTPRDHAGRPLAPAQLSAQCNEASSPDKLSLTGPFAAAVSMNQGHHWWLLRDRFGVQPLYFHHGHGFLLFGSELKALLASDLAPKRINLLGVDRYLTLRCVPGPDTILQGIHRVRPGCVLQYANDAVAETPFAEFDLGLEPVSRKAAATRVRGLLQEALARETSDTILWSAGIDCATLAGLHRGLQAVFVSLERGWQDEGRRAADSAQRLNLRLETKVAHRLSENTFNQAVYHLDEPLADATVLPLWLIAEAVRKVAPTVISGHGADELLGGFPRYHFLDRARGARGLVPASLFSELSPSLPPNAFVRRGSRYLASLRDNLRAYLSLVSVFDLDEREALYTDAMKSAVYDQDPDGVLGLLRYHFSDGDLTQNLLSFDLRVGLPDLLLTKCDRIAAAHGLTIHLPYLDDHLVDFVTTLPAKVKFGVRSKPLLRLATKGILPGSVRLRPRRDFRIPQTGRLFQFIENLSRQVITQERVEASGLFKWSYVDQILRSATHNVYRRRQFWALLMFFGWYRAVMET
ncbi:MAG: hypothetical protein HY706_04170 [Candidatus Hydrogenedentes bacterium]|nr:hypothetical protein [Candidatus Hydrogenedentota bacterium]